MATSTWRREEFVGRFFKVKPDKAVIEENGWTLNCFKKNFPTGHSWCIFDAMRDSEYRWWVLMASITTSIGPELHACWTIPIFPHGNSTMRVNEKHDKRVCLLHQETRNEEDGSPEKPFKGVSHLRMDNLWMAPLDRLIPLVWKDGTPIFLTQKSHTNWKTIVEECQIVERSEKDQFWALDKRLFAMKKKPKQKGEQTVFYTPPKSLSVNVQDYQGSTPKNSTPEKEPPQVETDKNPPHQVSALGRRMIFKR